MLVLCTVSPYVACPSDLAHAGPVHILIMLQVQTYAIYNRTPVKLMQDVTGRCRFLFLLTKDAPG